MENTFTAFLIFAIIISFLFSIPLGCILLSLFCIGMCIKSYNSKGHATHCSLCDKTFTKLNTGYTTTLNDGSYLCTTCFKNLPKEIRNELEQMDIHELKTKLQAYHKQKCDEKEK